MSVINQSISPSTQPTFPSKGSIPQDHPHHVTVMGSLPKFSLSRPFMHTPLKKTSPFTVGKFSDGEPSFKNLEPDTNSQSQNDLFQSTGNKSTNFHEVFSEDHINLLTQPVTESRNTEFETFSLNLLHSFMENEKINLMKSIMEELDFFYPKTQDTLLVDVSSAVKLEQRQMDQIARKMKKVTGCRLIKMENTIDPSLIAGFVLRYENDGIHVIDMSVKGQLAKLAVHIESMDQQVSSELTILRDK